MIIFWAQVIVLSACTIGLVTFFYIIWMTIMYIKTPVTVPHSLQQVRKPSRSLVHSDKFLAQMYKNYKAPFVLSLLKLQEYAHISVLQTERDPLQADPRSTLPSLPEDIIFIQPKASSQNHEDSTSDLQNTEEQSFLLLQKEQYLKLQNEIQQKLTDIEEKLSPLR